MTNYADESAARRASECMSVRVVSSPTDPMPNARRWVRERYGDDRHCRLITYGGTFFEWDGACWLEVEPEAVNAELYRYFEHAVYGTDQPSRFKPNSTKIANLVGSVRAVTHISRDHVVPSWLDGRTKPPATDIIPVANGILHVPSRKIYATTPALLVMHATPFAYDPSAPMPEGWLKFLKEIFPDDPESIMALQEWFGYLLSGDTSQQKILLIIGPKRSGKGTILRILKAIMGARHVAAPTLTSMSSNFGLQPLASHSR
jgi:putative DNA primase/helicase